ncbi:LysE family translocator [Allosediminivita pacifica]|uniref:Threonine/homoserine/homoserine lactone efflux protein n=1 Tax=Allosediminivita pacifica TaxID=1267769 RepID=A0A2T6AZY4_9RHOB|nr:LysE family translocator [Allosediminivita pacifica]PTX49323.1 threonine/homoserine/homoserine lactone efflux protein [Allosediminivita pacifica]GGB04953.1 threonine transporter RhtB [Allosediminivita pacifica]
MMDPLIVLAFLPAGLALNLTPGADMMFCLAQGLRGSARAGWAASAGVAVGVMAHVALAALGLGALVAAHPAAFDVIRWAGAAYLLWLAWKSLRTPLTGSEACILPPQQAAFQGLVVNLTNPKVILFVLALLPQFTNPTAPLAPQFLILGSLLAMGGFVINGLVGQFAARARSLLRPGARAERVLRGISATLFGGLAVRLVLSGRN